ncbi:MAG: TrkH family potassium uptake protein [Candidatus Hydrogenedentes bacterium]|nr:TrkH family potassium uptake protein [Candidatus Hydrogenedentota bacterium]
MNIRLVARYLGFFVGVLAVLFAVCLLLSLGYGEFATALAFLWSIVTSLIIACGLYLTGYRASPRFFQREALAVVLFSWILVGVLGGLPFVFARLLSPAEAIFESVSGLTTTGASVIDNLESYPHGILFWRALDHWFGGVGIVIMCIAVLPHLGAGGKQLFKSEASGPDPRALRPRIRESAMTLVQIYVALTAAQIVALLLTGDMNLFESVCHSFAAVSTGGFSTRQNSIGAFDSLPVELITIFFMLAGGTSFTLYFRFVRGDRFSFFKDAEWRFYMGVFVVATLLIALNTSGFIGAAPLTHENSPGLPTTHAYYDNPFHALREAAFTVASTQTNCGFVTDDFDTWPYFSRMLLVMIMFLGGSAGSTSGGIKQIRGLIVLKVMYARLQSMFRPKTIQPVLVNGEEINLMVQQQVLIFVIGYMLCFGLASAGLSLFGVPFDSAASSVATCMSNTGPGLELFGASETFSILSDGALLFLSGCMLLGRLEIFTFLLLFVPGFWRVR